MKPSLTKLDISFLVNKQLSLASFSQHQVIMNFYDKDANEKELFDAGLPSEKVRISIECEYKVSIDKNEKSFEEGPDGASEILCFLGDVISVCQYHENGDLYLRFESGNTITLLNSEEHYESYMIFYKGDIYAV